MATPNNFVAGLPNYGLPVFGVGPIVTTGDVFYVDSGSAQASDGNAGTSPSKPMATIDASVARCAANNGDIIYVMPGHAEATTAAITVDIAGIAIIGVGWGRSRPAITPTFGSAGDTITVTAANCVLSNLRVVAAGATQNAQINIAGDDCTVVGCIIEQGANNLIGVTIAGADRFRFSGCQFIGTAAGPDVGIDIETGDSADWIVEDCVFNYAGSTGLDLAGIRASFQQTGGLVKTCDFIAVDVTAIDINSSVSAQGDGIISRCNVAAGASVANIDTLIDAGGYILIENYGSDLPAEGGGLIPVTTPA